MSDFAGLPYDQHNHTLGTKDSLTRRIERLESEVRMLRLALGDGVEGAYRSEAQRAMRLRRWLGFQRGR